MYALLRRLLFNFPAESVHHFAMDALRIANRTPPFQYWMAKSFTPLGEHLTRTAWGLPFRNPIGLAAGFDKNALYLTELDMLGFGFVEIGTVTPKPQPGNDLPRLFRLPQDQALINRMGFNNDGAAAAADRIQHWREKNRPGAPGGFPLIIGGNIGKNKDTPNEEAWKDYERCFQALQDTVDYFVVNVSSPNTPGLRALQGKEALHRILGNLQDLNTGLSHPKPLLLKIAPDLTNDLIDDIIDLAGTVRLSGLVATNTTISRDNLLTPAAEVASLGTGGLSGAPLRERTTGIIRYIHEQTKGQLPIIGSGGIFSGKEAREKMDAGASLVQVWTGFIYEGPGIVKKICRELK
jgi:dihydroorotate dehydrogenase